jgi:hypothetical protein
LIIHQFDFFNEEEREPIGVKSFFLTIATKEPRKQSPILAFMHLKISRLPAQRRAMTPFEYFIAGEEGRWSGLVMKVEGLDL